MSTDKRQFCASISVRFDTCRYKIELSPAELHGGPEGCYRVRINRRWFDLADGCCLYLDREQAAALAAELATSGVEKILVPQVLPRKTRVRVPAGIPGASPVKKGWTDTDPVLCYDGVWRVSVFTDGGVKFYPVEYITVI